MESKKAREWARRGIGGGGSCSGRGASRPCRSLPGVIRAGNHLLPFQIRFETRGAEEVKVRIHRERTARGFGDQFERKQDDLGPGEDH
jgi:hypothetical protein